MNVSVIVLNYNGEKFIINCIKSLLNQTYANSEIIVVDNVSRDKSLSLINKKFKKEIKNKQIIIIKNEKNYGIPGLNFGIKAARGKYILTVGNDTKFDKGFIKEMVKVAESDKKVGMVSPKIVYFDRKIDTYGLRVLKSGMTKDIKDVSELGFLFCPSGCAQLHKKEMLKDIKLGEDEYFDWDFFAYADDYDLGFRARLMGWNCLCAVNAVCYHMHSASAGVMSDFGIYHGDRNRIWTIVKDWPVGLIFRNIIWIILLQLATIVKWAAKGKFLLIMKAKVDAIKGYPAMFRKRRLVQRSKGSSNEELKRLITFS